MPIKRTKERKNKNAYLEPALAYIDTFLERQTLQDHHTPGYSIAISHAGTIVYSRGFGYANIENQEKITKNHLFLVASHSKTFTAVAVMKLMEDDKLSIYDPASNYLPFLKDNPDPRMHSITLQNLLQHSSGIGRDGNDPLFWLLQRDFPQKEELIEYYRHTPLIIESNTRFKYSNYAYGLLGLIIETVSGQSYEDALRAMILKPLKLSKTFPIYDPDKKPWVTGYTGITPDGRYIPMHPSVDTYALSSATGFCANAEDLCRFYTALMPGSGRLLSDRTKRDMLRQHWEISDSTTPEGYGLGSVYQSYGDRKLRGHAGGMPGHRTYTLFDMDDAIVVSALSNGRSSQTGAIQRGIWHALDHFKQSWDPKSPYMNYTGHFYNLWGPVSFVPMGRCLYATCPDLGMPFDDRAELEHIDGHRFKVTKENGYLYYGENVEFIMDKNKRVSSVLYAGYPLVTKSRYKKDMDRLEKKYQQQTQ